MTHRTDDGSLDRVERDLDTDARSATVTGRAGTTDAGVADTGRRLNTSRRLNLLHRIGGGVLGIALAVFGVLGLVNRLDPFSTTGAPILGLSSNGLLSIVSLVAAALLVGAALRGGSFASTVLTVLGAAFLLSGVVNVLVLNSPLNILAFRISNVIFSLVAGLVLLTVGAYGRFSGRLPDDNPYRQQRHSAPESGQELPIQLLEHDEAVAAADLAEAERVLARGGGTAEQAAAVDAADRSRTDEDRLRAWRRHAES